MIIIINIVITITDGADAGVMQDINIHFQINTVFCGLGKVMNCVEVNAWCYDLVSFYQGSDRVRCCRDATRGVFKDTFLVKILSKMKRVVPARKN